MSEKIVTPVEVPDGKIADFIDGKFRPDNELEQVRQNFERTLIEEYLYDRSDITVDFRIKVEDSSAKSTKKASVVIFNQSSVKKEQDNVFVVILIVKPNIMPTDSKSGTDELEKMLVSCPNALYGCWTNGMEYIYFQKKKQKFDTDIIPVNDFPRKGEDDASIYTTDRSRLRAATGNNLLSAFKRCHDYIHGNQGGSKEQIFWEFLKILFAKIEDEQHDGRPRFAIRNADERNTNSGQKEVKDRIESLFREVRAKSYKGLFDDVTEGIIFHPNVVAYIVAQLEKYDFLHSSVDVKGMAYETIVGPTLEGTKGEFFTPRSVVKMTVRMLDPKPGDRVLDPACGTGGFIVVAFNYISEKIRQADASTWKDPKKPTPEEEKALYDKIHEAGKNVFGLDFNANLVKTAQMNMIMNNDGRGGLYSVNSLWKPSQWTNKQAYEEVELGSMDYVMANPPFGANIKVEGHEVLEQFDVAHQWRKQDDKWIMDGNIKTAVAPEVLFIERCIQFLKPGKGKLGIVLPNGILGTPEAEYIRFWLMQHCELLATVQLPVETFLPRTGTQTSVLICRRFSEQEKLARSLSSNEIDYNVFAALCRNVGKNRRGKIIYIKDEHGLELLRRDLYNANISSNLLDSIPEIEISGRIVDNDLWAIPSYFKNWCNNNRNQDAILLGTDAPIRDIPNRNAIKSTAYKSIKLSSWRLTAESFNIDSNYLKLELSDKVVSLIDLADVFTVYLQSPILSFLDEPIKGITEPFYSPSDLQKKNPRVRNVSILADKRIKALQVKAGWILISGSGTVGQLTLVSPELDGAIIGGDMIRIAPKNLEDVGFIYFFLSSEFGAEFFRMKSYGSVVEHLHPEEIKYMKIPVPSKETKSMCNEMLKRFLELTSELSKTESLGVNLISKSVIETI